MPQLENQQAPDPAGLVAALPEVFVEQLPDGCTLKVSPLQGFWIEQHGLNQRFQFVAHPVDQRQGKALFRPLEHLPHEQFKAMRPKVRAVTITHTAAARWRAVPQSIIVMLDFTPRGAAGASAS